MCCRVTQGVRTQSLTTSYAYDAAGHLTGLTYPSGRSLAFSYDIAGRVSGITVGGTQLINSIAYHPFGPATGWSRGSGATTYSRTFDQDGRVSGITFSGTGGNQTISLTYDLAGRITGITDSNGVRPSITTGTSSYSISSASNRLQSRTGPSAQTYTYDAAGNLTGDGTFTYGYDARGRLVQITTGGVTTSYAINGLGQRVRKLGTTTTIFVYGEAGHLLGEYDGTGSVIQETVWLGDLPVVVLKPGALYYLNPDHLGSPRSIIDSTGATVWKWDKDPFGN
ncbi:MAG: RHS repeat protein [Deltaproteobacteria bacterium]|nr:RHS repeat protein [Deltaproteobacteria bacterium]